MCNAVSEVITIIICLKKKKSKSKQFCAEEQEKSETFFCLFCFFLGTAAAS